MGTGALGYFSIARQNSLGTSTTSAQYVPILSESITTDIEQITLEGLENRFAEGNNIEGYEVVAGDVVLNSHPLRIGDVLRGSCGQVTTTNVTSTASFEDYVHEFFPLQADWDSETTLPPYTVQVFRDTALSFKYTDSVVNKIDFAVEAGGLLQVTAGIMSRSTSLTTATGPSITDATPFAWSVASISIGGNAINDFESITFSLDSGIEGLKVLNASKQVRGFKRDAKTTVRVSGTLNFANNTEWVRFQSQGTAARMLVSFDTMISSGALFTIDVPKMHYISMPPNLGGPGRISMDFEGQGQYDTNSSYAIAFTLTNTETAYE